MQPLHLVLLLFSASLAWSMRACPHGTAHVYRFASDPETLTKAWLEGMATTGRDAIPHGLAVRAAPSVVALLLGREFTPGLPVEAVYNVLGVPANGEFLLPKAARRGYAQVTTALEHMAVRTCRPPVE